MKFQGEPAYTSQDQRSSGSEPVEKKRVYIKAGLLIDGNGGAPVRDPVVELGGDRIRRVGTQGEVAIPPDATVVDCANYTLMPGLIDLHVHLMMYNCLTFNNYRVAKFEVAPQLQQMYALFHAQMCFDMGFTTLRDLGLNYPGGLLTQYTCSVRDSIEAGIFSGPRVLAGGWASITGSHLDLVMPRAMSRTGNETADGPWELRKLTRQNLRIGCDVIKTTLTGGGATDTEAPDVRNITQEELNAIVDEAHAFHKTVAAHCFTPEGQLMAVKAGVDTLEHMVFHSDESIDAIREAGVWVTPTLSHRTDHAIHIRKQMGAPRFVLEKMKQIQPFCYDTFQKMHKAGVPIAMGTDVGYDPEMGEGAKELELYVDLGMSPMEAIQTATRNAAAAMRRTDDLGTVEAGKIADLIAVDGDPAVDIKVLQEKQRIKMVMRGGVIRVDRRSGKHKSAVGVEDGSWKVLGR